MNITKHCRTFNLMFRVPDDKLSEVEAFFNSHAQWMNETHRGPEEPHPLLYTITKAPELKDALDSSKGTTGFTLIALTEIYRSDVGCKKHMDISPQWKDWQDYLETVVKPYQVGMIMSGEVIDTIE